MPENLLHTEVERVDGRSAMSLINQEPIVLELWELMNRCLGKPELAARVIQRFEKQLISDIDRISNALDIADYNLAREVTHRLKGAAANVAAHGLRDQAHSLESAIQLELVDEYALVFEGLLIERDRFLQTAQQIQLGQPSPS